MSAKQTCIRFAHPCGSRTSSQWRQSLLKVIPDALDDDVAVFQSKTALSLTARTPQASLRLRDSAVPVMRAVAQTAERMLDVEMLELEPSVAFTGYRWLYRVPRLVVARTGQPWEHWNEAALDPEHVEEMRSRIETDLLRQLSVWGKEIRKPAIEIESTGTAMVLKDAVSHGPRSVAAMARKDVVFSSPARIEGAFWVGLLQATGHGRVYRDGYAPT